jgi:hypothetical protein
LPPLVNAVPPTDSGPLVATHSSATQSHGLCDTRSKKKKKKLQKTINIEKKKNQALTFAFFLDLPPAIANNCARNTLHTSKKKKYNLRWQNKHAWRWSQ